jgi:UDP-N-acetylmuramyl pentapeptide phosphotransferase/UDP-N-acetylglucosamine-1-phosphate transferase
VNAGVFAIGESAIDWNAIDWTVFGAAAGAACIALLAFARAARALRLDDDGSDAPQRKTQSRAVPLVGGPALAVVAIALALWARAGGAESFLPVVPADSWRFEGSWLALAVAIAFATGLVDDARRAGLAPLAKLVGQVAAGCALAAGFESSFSPELAGGAAEPSFAARALVVFVAVAAQNIANTFDHADGTLGSMATCAYACAGSSFTGALAAFLGFNLARRRVDGPPLVFLGDSGSHAIGLLLATSSLGHAALTLPALDLARVVALRVRAGDPVWRGDQRHLGQRLRAAGRGPVAVVVLVLACAAPAFVALALALQHAHHATWVSSLAGAAGCGFLLALVLRLHPEREMAPPAV